MTVILWMLKNWKVTLAGLALVLMGGKLAMAEIQVNNLERKNLKLKVEILDCNTAIDTQNKKIEDLGKELAHVKRRSQDAHRRNKERLEGAEKRISNLRRVPLATDCLGAVSRFANQLKGEVW